MRGNDMYDIIIVGAGPAGSTFARFVADQKVLILDKRDVTSSNKCCGGLIAPDAQKYLGKFGLAIPQEVLVAPQLFTVRTMDLNQSIERYYQRNYLNVDRNRFDEWLVGMVPKTVEVQLRATVKEIKTFDDHIEVTYLQEKEEYTVSTKYLVGADGSNSMIRKSLLPNDSIKQYVAIQEWYEQTEPTPYYSAIFDSTITDFYAWTISKGPHLIVGAALDPTKDPISTFESLKNKLIQQGFQLDHLVQKEGSFIYRPTSRRSIYLGTNRILLIGEAAGLISPSSAEGFSYAFASAEVLGKVFQSEVENILQKYKKTIWKLRFNIQYKRLKNVVMYHPFLRKILMKTGLSSITVNYLKKD